MGVMRSGKASGGRPLGRRTAGVELAGAEEERGLPVRVPVGDDDAVRRKPDGDLSPRASTQGL